MLDIVSHSRSRPLKTPEEGRLFCYAIERHGKLLPGACCKKLKILRPFKSFVPHALSGARQQDVDKHTTRGFPRHVYLPLGIGPHL